MADLPEPGPGLQPAGPVPWAAVRGPVLSGVAPGCCRWRCCCCSRRCCCRAAGGCCSASSRSLLVFWLVIGVAAVFAAARFRRRMLRQWQQFHSQYQSWNWPAGYLRDPS